MQTTIPNHNQKAVFRLIEMMNNRHPKIQDIVIGFGRTQGDTMTAMWIKALWETFGGYSGEGGTVLELVSWNDASSSFNKYFERIKRHAPDAIVMIGANNGFDAIMKRLNHHDVDSQVYVLDERPQQLSLNYEGLTGVGRDGRPWSIERVVS